MPVCSLILLPHNGSAENHTVTFQNKSAIQQKSRCKLQRRISGCFVFLFLLLFVLILGNKTSYVYITNKNISLKDAPVHNNNPAPVHLKVPPRGSLGKHPCVTHWEWPCAAIPVNQVHHSTAAKAHLGMRIGWRFCFKNLMQNHERTVFCSNPFSCISQDMWNYWAKGLDIRQVGSVLHLLGCKSSKQDVNSSLLLSEMISKHSNKIKAPAASRVHFLPLQLSPCRC